MDDIAALAGVPSVLRGPEAVALLFKRIFETVSHSVEINEVVDLGGGIVMVRCVLHQTGRMSGVSGDVPLTQIWEIRRGRPIRVREYQDHRAALEAVGSAG